MRSVTVTTFSLRLKSHEGSEAAYCQLDELPCANRRGNRPVSLLGLLEQYLHGLQRQADRDENNKCLLTASQIHRKSNSVRAFLERGEYGIQSDMLNAMKVKTKVITYTRSVKEAEMVPHYILVAVPDASDRGIVALQMEGNTGLKSHFEQGFEDFLRARCGDCDLEIDKVVPESLVKQYFSRGRVAKLRFVRLRVPKTIDEAYLQGTLETDATMELRITPKRGTAFLLAENIQAILNKTKTARDFVQIQGFDYDTVKVDVKMGRAYHTIDLGKPDSFRADYDVTGEIQPRGGHPTYQSIDKAATKIVKEIMVSLNMSTHGV